MFHIDLHGKYPKTSPEDIDVGGVPSEYYMNKAGGADTGWFNGMKHLMCTNINRIYQNEVLGARKI